MRLKQLQIEHFRNLTSVALKPVDGINLIVGQNAAGKTSILESIYYLSHLRSFRSNSFSDIVQHGHENIVIFSKIIDEKQQEIPLGISRSKSRLEVRANKQTINKTAEITARFPVIAIHPDSYQLISGNPHHRRSFLDWGVFHVEHGFYRAWSDYKTALNQRNAALKAKLSEKLCVSWDKELIQAATTIDKQRNDYFQALLPLLQSKASEFFPEQSVSFEYRRGWDESSDIQDILQNNLQKDRMKGFTYHGPHRADLIVKFNGYSAQHSISRGQQKLLVALLRLSQAIHYSERSGMHCVLLYDDLAAELDGTHREQVLRLLSEMKIQLFVTAIEQDAIDCSGFENTALFHVEQGLIRQ